MSAWKLARESVAAEKLFYSKRVWFVCRIRTTTKKILEKQFLVNFHKNLPASLAAWKERSIIIMS